MPRFFELSAETIINLDAVISVTSYDREPSPVHGEVIKDRIVVALSEPYSVSLHYLYPWTISCGYDTSEERDAVAVRLRAAMLAPQPSIAEWVRENVMIEAEYTDQYGPDNIVAVRLRLLGDHDPFTEACILLVGKEQS